MTLHVPPAVARAAAQAGLLELVDPEGVPLAVVEVESTYPVDARTGIVGAVQTIGRSEFGAFRHLHLSPAEVRERYDGPP